MFVVEKSQTASNTVCSHISVRTSVLSREKLRENVELKFSSMVAIVVGAPVVGGAREPGGRGEPGGV